MPGAGEDPEFREGLPNSRTFPPIDIVVPIGARSMDEEAIRALREQILGNLVVVYPDASEPERLRLVDQILPQHVEFANQMLVDETVGLSEEVTEFPVLAVVEGWHDDEQA